MMKWRVEKATVVRRVWGPEDDYLTAGYDGPQVDDRKYKRGDVIYRVVSDYVSDPTDLYEFAEVMSANNS